MLLQLYSWQQWATSVEATIKDTARRAMEKTQDTRHGSNAGEIKPQTRQRHWQPAAGHQSQSVSPASCPSVQVTTSSQGEDICGAKFILHLQCRNLIKKCSVLGVSNTLALCPTPHTLPAATFSPPPPPPPTRRTCLGQKHAPAPCV